MAHDIFISYSHRNDEFCTQLHKELEMADISYWVDKHIGGGDAWEQAIFEAISDCQYLVLLLSIESAKSKEVKKELDAATRRNKTIIPVILNDELLKPDIFQRESGLNIGILDNALSKQIIKALELETPTNGRFSNLIDDLNNKLKTKIEEIKSVMQCAEVVDIISNQGQIDNDLDFITLGNMTANQILQGSTDWIETISVLEEKNKSHVLKKLKSFPDKTVFELMPEYTTPILL